MKNAIRIATGSGVLVAGLAVAGASSASAQVRVGGTFRLPHGQISFSVGDRFPIGGYVPYGYDVYQDVDYGYGFAYEDHWIPCEPRGTHWVIVNRPVQYVHRDYGYRDYRYSRGYRDYQYSRRYQNDRYGSSRDYRRYDDRRHRRSDRWRRDDRSHRRDDRRHRDGERRWKR